MVSKGTTAAAAALFAVLAAELLLPGGPFASELRLLAAKESKEIS
jgi:hypothetical protein